MIRLHITAEGQTEERFVKNCLAIHLGNLNVCTDVRLVKTSEDKRTNTVYRGGFRRKNAYKMVKKDITNWLREDRQSDCFFTTMFDFYALPNDFPGFKEAYKISDKYDQIQVLESALADDIQDRRFIPYIQLHEFETLIFVDPKMLAEIYLDREVEIRKLIEISKSFDNPELINNGIETAPSKRIISLIPEHKGNKTEGAIIAQKIGIVRLKGQCKHFSSWIEKLESLNTRG